MTWTMRGRLVAAAVAGPAVGLLGCAGIPEPPDPSPRAEPPAVRQTASSPLSAPTVPELSAPRPLPPVVRWEPPIPGEGTLVAIVIEPRARGLPIVELRGRLDDASLPLASTGHGAYLGLAAARLQGEDRQPAEMTLEIDVTLADGTRLSEVRRIPIASREFPSTRLSVARRFTAPSQAALERIREERQMVRSMLREVTAQALWEGPFIHPRPGRVTSPFGQKRVFNGELRSRHTGLDIHATTGTPVYATNSGRVSLARDLFFTGNTVYLDHGLGLHTAYFHLSAIEVIGEGQWVEKGDLIGRVGATGRVTGPHLHWGLYLHGVPLDPLSLLQPGFSRASERIAAAPPTADFAARP